MTEFTQICPCGSGHHYGDCCLSYHDGKQSSPTAEALMRARYSAYVMGDIDYLVKTTLPANRSSNLRAAYQSTHDSIRWLGLKVIPTWLGSESDKVGKVEFRADYEQDGRRGVHREVSRFRRAGGEWFYVDGEIKGQ